MEDVGPPKAGAAEGDRWQADRLVQTPGESRLGRRHRLLAMGAVVLLPIGLLALSLGLSALWKSQNPTDEQPPAATCSAQETHDQQERAERRYRLARAALDRCRELQKDSRFRHGEGRDLSLQLARGQKSFFEQILALPGDDRASRREHADAYLQLGNLEAEFGSHLEAIGFYEKALPLLQQLATEDPHHLDYLIEMGNVLDKLGLQSSKAGRIIEAEQAYRRAVDIRVELTQRQPSDLGHVTSQAETLSRLGQLLQQRGRWQDAGRAYRQGLERQELALWAARADKQPTAVAYERDLALFYDKLGSVFHHLRLWQGAEKDYKKALEHQEELAREHAEDQGHTIHLANTRLHIGQLMCDRGNPAAALDWFAQALTGLAKVPKREAEPSRSEAYGSRAAALNQLGRHADAVKDLDQALALADNDNRPRVQLLRAATQVRLGETDKGLAAAQEQLKQPSLGGDALYAAACVYAAAGTAEHQAQAVELLNQARAADYFKDPLRIEQMKKDHFLDGLRPRADYRQLVQALEEH